MIEIKDAYYFSHDSNAKDDPKCVMLIEQMGLEGYGIFWVLVETLRDQPRYQYPLALVPALARRYNTTSAKMRTVIENFGLFTVTEDGQFFFSHSLNQRMKKWDEFSEKQRLRVLKRWHPDDTTVLPWDSRGNTEPYQERKEKEKKEKEIKREDTESASADKPPEAEPTPYSEIKNLYLSLCPSFPRIQTLSANRKQAIHARWVQYGKSLDTFQQLFEKAESSAFLKGTNSRNWSADFDWMIKDGNMAKILEGKYDGKPVASQSATLNFSDPSSYSEQEEDLPEWAKTSQN